MEELASNLKKRKAVKLILQDDQMKEDLQKRVVEIGINLDILQKVSRDLAGGDGSEQKMVKLSLFQARNIQKSTKDEEEINIG